MEKRLESTNEFQMLEYCGFDKWFRCVLYSFEYEIFGERWSKQTIGWLVSKRMLQCNQCIVYLSVYPVEMNKLKASAKPYYQ